MNRPSPQRPPSPPAAPQGRPDQGKLGRGPQLRARGIAAKPAGPSAPAPQALTPRPFNPLFDPVAPASEDEPPPPPHPSPSPEIFVTEERRRNAWERLGGSALSISVVDGKIALDASDIGYTGKERTALGRINVPGKPKAALYHGEWFTLRAQDSVKLDIIMGDEGGIFSAAIMIEKEGTTYARTSGGMPLLPVLTVADMEDKEKALYPFIPPEFLQRSVFLAEKQSMLGSGWRID